MKTVLFVCVHNAGRSQMAEAFLNHLAEGKARALSAGTDPASSIDATVVRVMQEEGIDIGNRVPRVLTPGMLDEADVVVTMGCGAEGVCPATWVETEDWRLDDPRNRPAEEVREIRDQIKARVTKMLSEAQG